MSLSDLIGDSRAFARVAAASFIVITDVRGSTQAGHDGRGREVNYVGAACISAILNAFPGQAIPYVFGGDGATFVFHADEVAEALKILEQVRLMALSQYGLHLRVGSVSVKELHQRGAEVLLSRRKRGQADFYEFLGSGFALADALIKERSDAHNVMPAQLGNTEKPVNLSGLSCRLLPFRSQRGHIWTFVVESALSAVEQDELFQELLSRFDARFGSENICPIQASRLRHRWLPSSWLIEARAMAAGLSFFEKVKAYVRIAFENVKTKFVFKKNRFNAITALPSEYSAEVALQNDWVKLGGLLTLVLDLSDADADWLGSMLTDYEVQGLLMYGSHSADAAVVVCQLFSGEPHNHTHFVDGIACGLASAAGELKKKRTQLQLKTTRASERAAS